MYTYNGRNIELNLNKIEGKKFKASWYNPRDGKYAEAGIIKNSNDLSFDPPGDQKEGNDWVLVLDKI